MRRSVSPTSGSPVLPGGSSRADPRFDDRAARSHPSAAARSSAAAAARMSGGAPLASMGVGVGVGVGGLAFGGWVGSEWMDQWRERVRVSGSEIE